MKKLNKSDSKPLQLNFLDSLSVNTTSKKSSNQKEIPYNMGQQEEENKSKTISSSVTIPTTNSSSTKYNKWVPPAFKDRTAFFDWYDKYLQSEEWSEIRKEALKRDGHICKTCGCSGTKTNPLQVHHNRYDKVGRENEDMNCLVTLCKRCHKGIHRIIKATR